MQSNTSALAWSRVRYVLRAVRSVLSEEEEALHRGIVPDVAGATHAAGDAVIDHQPLELLAGVLAAAIRVMQQRIGTALRMGRVWAKLHIIGPIASSMN